jgi:predicted nuclease of predicted toxin-antitoxin system
VKFLIDAQLPPALAEYLESSGLDAKHVITIGLENADDSLIWDHAVANHATIITKDEDFAARIQIKSNGPAIVWLRIGNCSNQALFKWFTPMLPHIIDCLQNGEKLIEII